MFKKSLVGLTLALSLSSQALAFWGDAVPGPQPLIPPVKLLLASGQAGGFLPPSGPMPFPPQEELPMILASADMDEQLEGFEKGQIDITMRELGEIIHTLYEIDANLPLLKGTDELPHENLVKYMVSIIQTASDYGYVGAKTMEEIKEMTESWYK